MDTSIKKISLLTSLAIFVFLSACTDEKVDAGAKNEASVRAILAAMDEGAPAKFDAYCAADFQINNPFLPKPGSLEVFKGLMQGQKASFPDVKHEVVQMFSSGNMVCVRGIFSGTNTGPVQGNPPTGNKVVVPFIFTDEFDANGKVKIRHVQFDTGAFNAQLIAQK